MVNAYIANGTDGTVSVINNSTKKVIATIPVGPSPIGVAVTPDGSETYIANQNSDSVSVINNTTNTVVATITVGTNPFGVAVTPNGDTVYVTNQGPNVGSGTNVGTISVIDIASKSVVATITLATGLSPMGIAITPDSSTVYTGNYNATVFSSISVISTATNTVTANITGAASRPVGLAITPNGNYLYITDWDNSNGVHAITVIATATNTISTHISLPTGVNGPTGIAITPDGTTAYVGDWGTNDTPSGTTVTMIDIATNTVTTTIALGSSGTLGSAPFAVSITPDGGTVYVTKNNSTAVTYFPTGTTTPTVSTINVGNAPASIGQFIQQATPSFTPFILVPAAYITNSGAGSVSATGLVAEAVIVTTPVGSTPIGVAVTPDGMYVYVTNEGSGTVSVISAVSNTVIETITVGASPFGIAISPSGNNIYVANKGSNSVSVINNSTFVVTTITTGVGSGPTGIAITPDNAFIYITNYTSGTVSIFNAATGLAVAGSPVTVGTHPYGVIISPDGTKAFVANQGSNSVSVINTSTFAVSTITTGVGTLPTALTVNPAGTELYVTNQTSGTVSVFNTSTNALITTITVGTDPYGISFTSDGTTIYVVNNGSNTISVINASTNTVSATISVASGSTPVSFGQFIQPPSIPMTSIYTAPQGRLAPSTVTSPAPRPVLTGDVTGAGYVFYVPYQGNIVPIYDGANMQSYTFGSLMMTLNTSNQLSGKIYDLFVFLNSSVVTIGAGPAWSSSTSRSAGVQQTNGIWVNAATITLTNGATSYSSIPVSEATYVGSIYMTAAGQTGMACFPTPAAGGSHNILGVWNAYNRVAIQALCQDSNTSWTYASATTRNADGNVNNRISWIDGLGQSSFSAAYNQVIDNSSGTGYENISIGFNITDTDANIGQASGTGTNTPHSEYNSYPVQGFNYVQAVENAPSGTGTFFGGGYHGLILKIEM